MHLSRSVVFCCVRLYHLVQVNQDAGDGVQEAGQLEVTVLISVGLSQVHDLAALDQLCIHQVYVLGTNLLARLQSRKDLFNAPFSSIKEPSESCF